MSKLGYNLHSGEVTILQKQKVHDFGRAARLNAFNKASALASAHGIKVEKDAAGGWWVDCNKFPADSDPLDGHHFCSDGHEVLSAVEIYVEVLTKAAQGHAQQADTTSIDDAQREPLQLVVDRPEQARADYAQAPRKPRWVVPPT